VIGALGVPAISAAPKIVSVFRHIAHDHGMHSRRGQKNVPSKCDDQAR
jgi:hypothetical protein